MLISLLCFRKGGIVYMSYKKMTIKATMKNIYENKIYLPAIQRKFVWEVEKITELFDSIMKGYPIGTFLFWNLKGEDIKQYTFYSFILHFHERDNCINKTAAKPEQKNEIIGILDGQQRLNSMYVSLQGTYAYKKPYARWDDDSAFSQRILCLNLLKSPNDNSDEKTNDNYEFKFLTDKEIQNTSKESFWFPIRNVLEWKDISNCNKYAKEKGYIENDIFINNLSNLWSIITQAELINYFEIDNPDVEEILPIFVRINNAGTPLSKTDLLFSTIVAYWQEGRQEIDSLLQTINKKGHGFYFGNDFIMRSCLALTDSPVLFKVKTFKRENIQKIKDNWSKIKDAIINAINLIVEFGFNSENLTSDMAVIVIAYFIYNNSALSKEIKSEIRKYLILALLNKIYGGKPDQIITKIRDCIKENRYKFSLTKINEKMDSDKKLSISEDRLEEILSESKGAYTFMVLSLLYPNLKLNQIEFHQDHIHPASMFNYDSLKKAGLLNKRGDNFHALYYKKDELPNLQLLEGRENESKNSTSFKEWFTNNVPDKKKYKKDYYIPGNTSLEFEDFEEFYDKRKELLKNKLRIILKI